MKIRIIVVGKNKDRYLDEGMAGYLKMLRGFADVEVVEVKESRTSKTFTVERCVAEEGDGILRAVGNEFLVVMDENGREMGSKEFAGFLGKRQDAGDVVSFVIGGAFGLSKPVKERANILISMSKMTFTHQMIRLFLLEQLYRGFAILNNKEYHHE